MATRQNEIWIPAYNCRVAKATASTGIMPMALVAVEQYFPKAQRVIDDAARDTALSRGEGGPRRRFLQPPRVG
jgi:hypothetical protein